MRANIAKSAVAGTIASAGGGARCGLPCATGVSKMPDGMMSAPTQASSQNQTVSPQETCPDIVADVSGLPAVWHLIDDIDGTTRDALVAFNLVFGIMEETSESVNGLDNPDKKWLAHYLPGYVDQLYYLLSDIETRVKTVRGKSEEIFKITRSIDVSSHLAPVDVDPVEDLAKASLDAEDAFNVADCSSEEEWNRLEEVMEQTAERLIAHRTITPLGILRKLEYAARIECFEDDLRETPQLAAARIVMGLIGDLKQSLDLK